MTSLYTEVNWVMALKVKAGRTQLIKTLTSELEEMGVTLLKSSAPWQTARHQSKKRVHPRELRKIKGVNQAFGPAETFVSERKSTLAWQLLCAATTECEPVKSRAPLFSSPHVCVPGDGPRSVNHLEYLLCHLTKSPVIFVHLITEKPISYKI